MPDQLDTFLTDSATASEDTNRLAGNVQDIAVAQASAHRDNPGGRVPYGFGVDHTGTEQSRVMPVEAVSVSTDAPLDLVPQDTSSAGGGALPFLSRQQVQFDSATVPFFAQAARPLQFPDLNPASLPFQTPVDAPRDSIPASPDPGIPLEPPADAPIEVSPDLLDEPLIIDEIPANPSLDILEVSTVLDGTLDAVDDVVEFVITVTNTGDAILYNIEVTDPRAITDLNPTGLVGIIAELAPGESSEPLSFTYVVTQADLDAPDATLSSSASAIGYTLDGLTVLADTTAFVPVVQLPVIDLLDVATTADGVLDQLGEKVTFNLTVTNNGNVTVFNIEVRDPRFPGGLVGTISSLAPGQVSDPLSFNYVLTQADLASPAHVLLSTATASGLTAAGQSVSDTEFVALPIVPVVQPPALMLALEAIVADGTLNSVGDQIQSTLTITNTGSVTLFNVEIYDPRAMGEGNLKGLVHTISEIAPGAVYHFGSTAIATQQDIDNPQLVYGITASAVGYTERLEPVTADVSTSLGVVHQPSLLVVTDVTIDDGVLDEVGEPVSYTLTVTNTGAVTLYDVIVVDPRTARGDQATGQIEVITELAPGASRQYIVPVDATQADLDDPDGILSTTVQATGLTSTGQLVAANDDVEVAISARPSLSLEKEVIDFMRGKDLASSADHHSSLGTGSAPASLPFDPSGSSQSLAELFHRGVEAGDLVVYRVVLTNTGNQTLFNVRVSDPLLAFDGLIAELKPGTSQDYVLNYIVTAEDVTGVGSQDGDLDNIAYAFSDRGSLAVNDSVEVPLYEQHASVEQVLPAAPDQPLDAAPAADAPAGESPLAPEPVAVVDPLPDAPPVVEPSIVPPLDVAPEVLPPVDLPQAQDPPAPVVTDLEVPEVDDPVESDAIDGSANGSNRGQGGNGSGHSGSNQDIPVTTIDPVVPADALNDLAAPIDAAPVEAAPLEPVPVDLAPAAPSPEPITNAPVDLPPLQQQPPVQVETAAAADLPEQMAPSDPSDGAGSSSSNSGPSGHGSGSSGTGMVDPMLTPDPVPPTAEQPPVAEQLPIAVAPVVVDTLDDSSSANAGNGDAGNQADASSNSGSAAAAAAPTPAPVIAPALVEPGVLMVGSSASDVERADQAFAVGHASGAIMGTDRADVLVGDPGADQPLHGLTANVVLCLDVSGSMTTIMPGDINGLTRLAALQQSVASVLQSLSESSALNVRVHLDQFSTVASPLGTYTLIENGTIRQSQLDAALSDLAKIKPSGFTNYEAGLQSSLNWIRSTQSDSPFQQADLNKVLFISDGDPNRVLTANTVKLTSDSTSSMAADQAMQHVLGSYDVTGSVADDTVNEVSSIEALGGRSSFSIEAIGLVVGQSTLDRLSVVEGVGGSSDLAVTLQRLQDLMTQHVGLDVSSSPLGSDHVVAGSGDDLIFGDLPCTDDLARSQGLSTAPGSGWSVFAQLEAGLGQHPGPDGEPWTRDTTLAYLRDNADVLAANSGRVGGADVISAGPGDDHIYGQDGDDRILPGPGVDEMTGGLGADRFVFSRSDGEHVDTIRDFGTGADKVIFLNADSASVVASSSGRYVFSVNWTDGVSSDVVIKVEGSSPLTSQSFGFEVAPVVLDLDRNGLQFDHSVALADSPFHGSLIPASFISAGDGLLAYDVDGDGRISQSNEVVFTHWSPGSATDMQALLSAFDHNHDGMLTSADPSWSSFVAWADFNADGLLHASEVVSLEQLGIHAIDLYYQPDSLPAQVANGDITIYGTSTLHWADGSVGQAADAAFTLISDPSLADPSAPLHDLSVLLDQVMANPQILADGAAVSSFNAESTFEHQLDHSLSVDLGHVVDAFLNAEPVTALHLADLEQHPDLVPVTHGDADQMLFDHAGMPYDAGQHLPEASYHPADEAAHLALDDLHSIAINVDLTIHDHQPAVFDHIV